MDEAVNRYAHELIEAINTAVAQDPDVRACRERARVDGFELTISLEAVIGVAGPDGPAARMAATVVPPSSPRVPTARPYDITAADRRFLRSLRIAADPAEDA